ncbi:MAG: hypothetical protein NZV14_13705 [Bryobacteraceae bacterium]|nr:hypothetical protein [Bryobacteraceae bacterium]MDW8379214.1 hypothetical protein [Bryobacterales bacterium]
MPQPIHTVYGGAHLFRHDTAAKLASLALCALEQHDDLIPTSPEILGRVERKLRCEAVEDFRIDFEDGYGYRSDDEEDHHAQAAAEHVRRGLEEGTLPPMMGIRIKSFHTATRARAIRTLELFFRSLGGKTPDDFAVCLPKASTVEEVADFRQAVSNRGEQLALELMVETPQALLALRDFVDAAGPSCRAVHFGPYDFTAACGIVSSAQGLRHPLCDYARNTMLVALAGRNIWLSDGPTTVLPLGGREEVARAWRLQWEDIQHALACGFFQGWDLHPAQIPLRYAAVFSFFESQLPVMKVRRDNFQRAQQQATRVGAAFEDAATARGLENFFRWERFFPPSSVEDP